MRLAVLKENNLVLFTSKGAINLSDAGYDGEMIDFIKTEDAVRKEILKACESLPAKKLSEAEAFSAPIKNPSKIVAVGLNYSNHAKESKMEIPSAPLIFAKFPGSITGPADPIIIPDEITSKVDFEAELGVIIGKTAKNVRPENALDYVFGYTVINDISARDIQFSESQWVRGKSLDTFCPMGPFIITSDEIADPQNLQLGCEVNGIGYQNGNTKDMIFSVAELISILSKSFTFYPGDIIATGTPEGVGFSRTPPVYLKHGDVVTTWVKGIGELRNPVVKE